MSKRDPDAKLWRIGLVELRCPGFETETSGPQWKRERGAITIRPHESIAQVRRRVAQERRRRLEDVRIVLPW